jgi:type I restriction enzyme S subunit
VRGALLKHACTDAGQYGLNVSAAEYVDQGVRLLRTTDLGSGSVADEGVFIEGPVDPRFLIKAGDLLLSRSGTVGQAYLATATDEGSSFAGYLVRFRPRVSTDPRFLFYATQSQNFQDQIGADAVVSTIANFNADRYANVEIPLPGAYEQRRIAEFLDDQVARIDNIIAGRRKHAEASRNLYIERLTGLTIGDAPYKPTGLRWMPLIGQDRLLWKVGLAFRTGSGTTPKSSNPDYFDGPYPWVNTGDLRDEVITKVPRSVSEVARREYTALVIYPPGTLLVAMYGATVGRLGMLGIDACVNQACCALLELGPVMTRYAYYWFLAYRDAVMQLSSGGGQPNISQEIVRALRIPAPDNDAQASIVQIADAEAQRADSARQLIASSIDLLHELKRSLITAAVTGEFDVSSADGSRVPA